MRVEWTQWMVSHPKTTHYKQFQKTIHTSWIYVIICIDQLEIQLWRIEGIKPRKVKVEASAREMAFSGYWNMFQSVCFTLAFLAAPGGGRLRFWGPWVNEEDLNLETHYTLTLSWLAFVFRDTAIDPHGLSWKLWVVLWLQSWICVNNLFLLPDSLSLPLCFIFHGHSINPWMTEWMNECMGD